MSTNQQPATTTAQNAPAAVVTTARTAAPFDLIQVCIWLALADAILCVGAWLGAGVCPTFAAVVVVGNCTILGICMCWNCYSFVSGWSNRTAELAAWAVFLLWAGVSLLLLWITLRYPDDALLCVVLLAIGFLWRQIGGEQGRFWIAKRLDKSRLRDGE